MPDWRADIHARLAPLRLATPRESDIAEELAQHLEDRYTDLRSRGHSSEQALQFVRDELAGDALADALTATERPASHAPAALTGEPASGHLLADLWRDIRYGMRALRKAPGFTGGRHRSHSLSASALPRRCSRCSTRSSSGRCHSRSPNTCSGSTRPTTRRKAASARSPWRTSASCARMTGSSRRSRRTCRPAMASHSSSAIARSASSARSSVPISSRHSASAPSLEVCSTPAMTHRAHRHRSSSATASGRPGSEGIRPSSVRAAQHPGIAGHGHRRADAAERLVSPAVRSPISG